MRFLSILTAVTLTLASSAAFASVDRECATMTYAYAQTLEGCGANGGTSACNEHKRKVLNAYYASCVANRR
jgi:hypothetical protein